MKFTFKRCRWVGYALFFLSYASLLLLMINMPGSSHVGPPVPLNDEGKKLADDLKAHVNKLAEEIGERNFVKYDNLAEAAAYIDAELKGLGYRPKAQGYELSEQSLEGLRSQLLAGGFMRQDLNSLKEPFVNIEVEIRGSDRVEEIVLVCAHYDSVVFTPGADDNASGVAALLETARAFAGKRTSRTVRLVFFANEEPPFFQTDDMGSRVYARRARELGELIVAAVAIESIGYYSTAQGSQKYPFPFGLFYPKTGNFVAFVGDLSSIFLVRQSIGVFRDNAAFPSEGLASPDWVIGVGWSDHWSFWQEGYRGVMITDTAPFRNRNYHKAGDTPESVDFGSLARVTSGIIRVVDDLANGP